MPTAIKIFSGFILLIIPPPNTISSPGRLDTTRKQGRAMYCNHFTNTIQFLRSESQPAIEAWSPNCWNCHGVVAFYPLRIRMLESDFVEPNSVNRHIKNQNTYSCNMSPALNPS